MQRCDGAAAGLLCGPLKQHLGGIAAAAAAAVAVSAAAALAAAAL
eukprot:CAMPEP_0202758432 /NCGR_PEP_ID=MMETSP1388-20130828/17058_1 /ASSEMBLY_ACC=CAM_ASM_000864 /TAXON_ID=37098 /ORGANISM="Isochrysis sp, Strain CCMP1244" /LENGTH=44 /DNA_ID= /DNA_START= /DNA_END= /DNA_ORIENTATION=